MQIKKIAVRPHQMGNAVLKPVDRQSHYILCRYAFCLLLLFPIVVLVPTSCRGQSTGDASAAVVRSPDKRIAVRFYQQVDSTGAAAMYYTVYYKGKPIIRGGSLDIQLDNHLTEQALALKVDKPGDWCADLKITGIDSLTKDTTWKPVCGERSRIRDHYHALVIHLVKKNNPIYKLNVEIRAYNEGVAIRYFFPFNPKGAYYHITSERTTFPLPSGTKAWFTGWAQGPYQLLPLKNWPQQAARPLTLVLPDSTYVCLAEAQMVNYARTKFELCRQPNTVMTSLYGAVDLISPAATPWRVILIADTPGQLLEHDYLLLNLNAPDKIRRAGWIKPGKMMRVVTQTTRSALNCIDFAAAHHLQYILFDWKWYGPAFRFSSDATKVTAPLDMPRIIRYAADRGIGVWLYVNQQALLRQSDSLFRIYHAWGVKGVKFGFVQAGSHRWTTWLEKTIQKAAASHIMVDVHDEFRPTGEERTYPNLMTAEGIRGNEEMPDAKHNTILPFTRFIAGPADYTICYYDKRIKTTHAHQLALSVLFYSPVETLFWYDKPSDYQGEPEIKFFEDVPTTWDDTRVLQGRIGQYIVMARRKGNDWFLGGITNDDARKLVLPLGFLPKGKKYEAQVYYDDPAVPTRTHVGIRNREVTSGDTLHFDLEASGGIAIRFHPS